MPQHLRYERRMQRTRQPCRQLNSEGIKSTALCYLTPVISGRCSIIRLVFLFLLIGCVPNMDKGRMGQGARMQRTRQPCRQLNSESIKSTALCYLMPVISGRCSIISAKCVCKVKDKALPKAWATVCGKRDLCDRAISG